MSLRGRQFLDRLNQNLKSFRVRLPSPPYGNPQYWNITYKDRSPHDQTSMEWGNLTLEQDLLQYEYKTIEKDTDAKHLCTTTWSETIDIDSSSTTTKQQKRIMIIGCGYSRLGNDMMKYPGWKNMTQVDICSKVISDLTPDVSTSSCDYIEDDANHLSAFADNTMDVIIDKGLMDCLHLDTANIMKNEGQQITNILTSASRVLKPNGIFVFFSLSQPQYLFPSSNDGSIQIIKDNVWSSKQARLLLNNNVLLYRYQKKSKRKAFKNKRLSRKQR
mmetsp:Transcript_19653/g.29541  ORF Transcript_19653/g.29541 Transcript_19653/m.29541 type:complete len:274 (+) Transcript_19653:74-895(+)